jgi:hypothetical protein
VGPRARQRRGARARAEFGDAPDRLTNPEEYAQRVGGEEHERDERAEALALAVSDVEVLRDVAHDLPEHEEH